MWLGPVALACALTAWAPLALAQTSRVDDAPTLAPVLISGEGSAQVRAWTAPGSIDVVGADEVRDGQAQVNVSESLGRVPGLQIRNRSNYAQDLQLSIRGYGARASFGVRGIRLYVDGIPLTAPDGQGQTAGFALGAAERIEVIRGPYAALFGASAGGAVLLSTESGRSPGLVRLGAAVGGDGFWRLSSQVLGATGTAQAPKWRYALDVSGFATDGFRPQSAADRSSARLKLDRSGDWGQLTLSASTQRDVAQDPQGLTGAQLQANPFQTGANALAYNTRKTVQADNLGASGRWALGAGQALEMLAYAGQRGVVQFQSITPGAQNPASSGGGVIDFDRRTAGAQLRWRRDATVAQSPLGAGRLTQVLGLAVEQQDEDRRGFENFTGPSATPTSLGVQGRLRRQEANQARSVEPFGLLEWSTSQLGLTAGLRRSQVRLSSSDQFVRPGNPDDSGATRFDGWLPMLGARWSLSPDLQLWASAGRGLESPTLNEVAYRGDASRAGLNTDLRASSSTQSELGLRWRHAQGSVSAAWFDVATRDEIAVLTNAGGRAVFQNVGRTRRQGLELSALQVWGDAAAPSGQWLLQGAGTWLQARYRDAFATCAGTPCPTPTVPVAAGSRMPGVAERSLYLQAAWERALDAYSQRWFVEARHQGPVAANDANTESAAAHTVWSAGVQAAWPPQPPAQGWQWRAFARVDNLTQRRYAASVIVNEGNRAFFEPGAPRRLLLGVTLSRPL